MHSLSTLITVAGGLGLFLLGMVVMTESLRSLAGRSIRNALMRFTRTPFSGAITGAIGTAILQSSSATTVAAVGFVSAGLLSFSQALGIIFGANIGTTITGWLVALLGFKLKLTTVLMPLILVGVLLRMSNQARLRPIGLALAGFGLIFVGIDTLQVAMAGMDKALIPSLFPEDNWANRLQLLGIGILVTMLTQSSSAGIATTITALFVGAINFHQAAALVIGMDMGTTVTAALASIGGSRASRRTGFSHVIFNLFTGVGAFFFITPFTQFWSWFTDGAALSNNAEIALVAFHTSFNTLGTIIVLPLTGAFARMMYHLFPEEDIPYTQSLEPGLLQAPDVAITATRVALIGQFQGLLDYVRRLLGSSTFHNTHITVELSAALQRTQTYIEQLHIKSGQDKEWQRLSATLHALDHLQRLLHRCQEPDKAQLLNQQAEVQALAQQMISSIDVILAAIQDDDWQQARLQAEQQLNRINHQAPQLRAVIMGRIASGELVFHQADDLLDALRWQGRAMNHITRIGHYLQESA